MDILPRRLRLRRWPCPEVHEVHESRLLALLTTTTARKMSVRSLRTLRSLRSASRLPSIAARGVVPAVGSSASNLAPLARRHLNTINADEVAHFSKLSEHWWDEQGEFGLLHRMNPERVEFIRQKVALDPENEPEWTFEGRHQDAAREAAKGTGQWLKGKRCLDVGCGGGLLAEVSRRFEGVVEAKTVG